MPNRSILGAAAFAAIVSLTLTSTTQAADPAVKCESGKLKESAKYSSCRLKAESKAVKKSETPDYTKCETKFADKWGKTELKAGPGVCPTEGDVLVLNGLLTDCADSAAFLLSGQTTTTTTTSTTTTTTTTTLPAPDLCGASHPCPCVAEIFQDAPAVHESLGGTGPWTCGVAGSQVATWGRRITNLVPTPPLTSEELEVELSTDPLFLQCRAFVRTNTEGCDPQTDFSCFCFPLNSDPFCDVPGPDCLCIGGDQQYSEIIQSITADEVTHCAAYINSLCP